MWPIAWSLSCILHITCLVSILPPLSGNHAEHSCDYCVSWVVAKDNSVVYSHAWYWHLMYQPPYVHIGNLLRSLCWVRYLQAKRCNTGCIMWSFYTYINVSLKSFLLVNLVGNVDDYVGLWVYSLYYLSVDGYCRRAMLQLAYIWYTRL